MAGGWTGGWTGGAISASGGLIQVVSNTAALPTATGSEVDYLVRSHGGVLTDCDVEGDYLHLPTPAVRASDSTMRTLAWARDGAGEKCKIFPGDTIPVGWTVNGTITTTGGVITLSGYVFTSVVSTAPRVLVVAKYHDLPTGLSAESGVTGGSVVSGTSRWINTRLTPSGTVTHGLYQTTTSKGALTGQAGETIYTLIDQSAAASSIQTWSAGGAPGQSVLSERADMSSSGAYFQVMSVIANGTGLTGTWDLLGLITLT